MKREIKFRAWDSYTKRMFQYGEWHHESVIGRAITGCVAAKDWVEACKNIILQQFTGLKDKNGKEIYEGDIVSYQRRLYEVCINFNGFYLQRYKLWNGKFKPAFQYSMCLITKPFKNGDRGENGGIVDTAEVIGNVYENPELLERLKDIQPT